MSDARKNLARQTVSNALWNYGTFALGKGVIFLNTIILARILDPRDFGLLALGLIVVAYLEVINDFGISAAVIYKQDNPEYTANVAFWFNMLTGTLLTILGFLIAPLAANFFNEESVTLILRVLSLSFVISSVSSIHEARLKKELKFKRRVLPEFSKSVAKGLVSIPLALAGFGVWSLVWGQIASMVVGSIMYWRAFPWMPRLEIDGRTTRALLNYGSQMILIGVLGQVHKNVDYLLVGKRLNSEQLGFYTLAFRLPELIIVNMVTVVGQVAFPTYAKLQNDIPTLRDGFLTTLRFVSLFTMPIGFGIFVIAPELVTVFYTDRWEPVIRVMQVLSLYAVVYSLSYNSGDIYKAIGRPGILNKLAVVKLLVTVPILYVAASYNIYYVALGQLFTTIILTILRLAIVSHIIQTDFRAIWASIRPATTCVSVMFVGTLLIRGQLDGIPALPRMIIVVIAGGILYIGTFGLLYQNTLMQVIATLKTSQQKNPAT